MCINNCKFATDLLDGICTRKQASAFVEFRFLNIARVAGGYC